MPRLTQRRLTVWLQVASLAAAAWFVWFHSVVPRLGQTSLIAIVSQGMVYLTFALLSVWAITACTYLVTVKGSVHGRVRNPLATISVAIWYAPAMIVASSFSPISLGASLIIVISTTRVLVAGWTAPTEARASRDFTPARVLAWRALFAVLASATVHGGVLAMGGGWNAPAAALFALSAAVITALAIVTGAHTPRTDTALPHSILGLILTLLLALGITSVRYGGWGNTDLVTDGAGQSNAKRDDKRAQDSRLPADGDFPGVILTTERPPQADPFVVPSPSRRPAGEAASSTIPFTGEYWLFRAPSSRPPTETSFRASGSLLDFSFSTTDGFPLLMEARQTLERPIALDCCASFEVMLTSQDLIPGSAWLELYVIDSENRGYGSFRIGRAALRTGGRESLTFTMPAGIFLEKFDEFRVAIRQARGVNRSVKLRVDGFRLIPRTAL